MRKRYRYILSGLVSPADSVSDFRLIAGNMIKPRYAGRTAIRFEVPEDMELEKWSCDSYSTTDDARTLEHLGYDFMVWSGSRWMICNELKGYQPHEVTSDLLRRKGFIKRQKQLFF